ncbi:AP-3 complex subunit beta-2 [Phthorimaea operculella]|nr:AP-3 complex subunit beta-2 [Phthorimaea operculella]
MWPIEPILKFLLKIRLAPNARAAAVWLVAEHGAKHPRAAAILAHMANNFADQDELVKLQLLSLAVKLSITQPDTLPVCQYILSLARYDASYDVRDRARMLRRFIEPSQQQGSLIWSTVAADVFCPDKPKPTIQSAFKDRQQYTIGTLSQYIGTAASGYRPLPTAPSATVGASLRETAAKNDVVTSHETNNDNNQKNKSFYSEPESSGSGSGSSSEESSSEEESSEEEESTNENEPKKVAKADRVKQVNNYRSRSESSNSGTSDSASDSDSETESGSDSESADSSGESDPPVAKPANKVKEKKVVTNQKQEKQEANQEKKNNDKSNLELLLELDDAASTLLPTMTPTCGGFLSPANTIPGPIGDGDAITPVGRHSLQLSPLN